MDTKLHAEASRTIRWNLFSSTIFEIAKAGHYIALYLTLPIVAYSNIAIQFSLVYLVAFLAGLEGGASIVPHLKTITQLHSPRNFLTTNLVLPQFILYGCAATIMHYHLQKAFAFGAPIFALLCVLTISEGVRSNLRTVLHPLYGAKHITLIEHPLNALYFIWVWGGYYSGCFPLTIHNLLVPLAATSAIVTAIFLYKVATIPNNPNSTVQTPTNVQLMTNRFNLTILHMPRHLFSGNFLVPFFAHAAGPLVASLIKLASSLANAIRALLKVTIGTSLDTLLTKHKQQGSPQETFKILWRQLNEILLGAAIILGCLLPQAGHATNKGLSILLAAFVTIAVIDYLFIIYEHFYTMHHRAGTIARYRSAEFIGGALSIWAFYNKPLFAMGVMVLIKATALGCAIQHAHSRWQIHPHINIRPRVVGYTIIIGIIVAISVAGLKACA